MSVQRAELAPRRRGPARSQNQKQRNTGGASLTAGRALVPPVLARVERARRPFVYPGHLWGDEVVLIRRPVASGLSRGGGGGGVHMTLREDHWNGKGKEHCIGRVVWTRRNGAAAPPQPEVQTERVYCYELVSDLPSPTPFLLRSPPLPALLRSPLLSSLLSL